MHPISIGGALEFEHVLVEAEMMSCDRSKAELGILEDYVMTGKSKKYQAFLQYGHSPHTQLNAGFRRLIKRAHGMPERC